MEEAVISNNQTESKAELVRFWTRAGAYLLDIFILSAFSLIINAINIANFKSFFLYLVAALIAILYKPFMESRYGATLGKMTFNIKVTDKNFNQIGFSKSFLRSFILIFPMILYLPFYYFAFRNPNLLQATQIIEFSQALAAEYPLQKWIGDISFLIIVVDLIVLLVSKTKQSLHDQIAKTYVIYNKT